MKEKNVFDQRQNLKRQRMKMYFLDAAKEMIANEGIESVSVRKVAEVAGYSYATLYNYFEDLNELLWEVKRVMINDLAAFMQKKIHHVSLDKEGVKRLFKIYCSFYFKNPHVFKFFYFHKLIQPSRKSEDREVAPDFDRMMKETFKGFVTEGKLREMDLEVVGKTCIYAVHGMLVMLFCGNGDLTEESVYKELDKMIDYLF